MLVNSTGMKISKSHRIYKAITRGWKTVIMAAF